MCVIMHMHNDILQQYRGVVGCNYEDDTSPPTRTQIVYFFWFVWIELEQGIN